MKIDKDLKITMKRRQITKLLLAIDAICIMAESCAGSAMEWKALRNELQEVLEAYDSVCFQCQKEEEA